MSMRVRWREFELPNRVECDKETSTGNYGQFVIEPFERDLATLWAIASAGFYFLLSRDLLW